MLYVMQNSHSRVCGRHSQPTYTRFPDRLSQLRDFAHVGGRSLAGIDLVQQVVDLVRSQAAWGTMSARFVHEEAGNILKYLPQVDVLVEDDDRA